MAEALYTDFLLWSARNEMPSLYPRRHRELLRAIVAVRLGISYYKINLKALDAAYTEVFPHSTPINVNKKKRDKSYVTKRN